MGLLNWLAGEAEYFATGGEYGNGGRNGRRNNSQDSSSNYDDSSSDDSDSSDWSEDYETQQRSRKIENYRGIQLRNMGGDTDKVKRAVDRVLDNPKISSDFRRRVDAIDYAHVLRHVDGSAPTGFSGRGDRNGGRVISTRTANTDKGLYTNLVHELGHKVAGDSEEDAEAYAHSKGVYEEDWS